MIQETLILGQIGKAIHRVDDRYFVIDASNQREPVECRPGDVSLMLDSGAEVSSILSSTVDFESVRDSLEFSTRAYRSLAMTLGGLDKSLTAQTRSLCVEAAEELMQENDVGAFVKARLFARPLPTSTDVEGGIACAKSVEAPLVQALFTDLTHSQETIHLMLDSWEEMAPEFFNSEEEQAAGEKLFIEFGVFAKLASALSSNPFNPTAVNSIIVEYGTKLSLLSVLPRAPQILNNLRAILFRRLLIPRKKKPTLKATDTDKLQAPIDVTSTDISGAILNLITDFDKRRLWKPSKQHEVEERIKNQIAAVGKLVLKGELRRANEFLLGLLEFHLKHSEKKHVAMSLCALATLARDAYSFEFAKELLVYAFALNEQDPFIWCTQAEVLRASGEIESALTVYEEAISLFPNDEIAIGGYATTLSDLGRFDEALEIYEALVDRTPDNRIARDGYAETLKRVGDFDSANKVYRETIHMFPDDVVAYTGLAETLKAMGDLDSACKTHKEVTARFPESAEAHNAYAEVLKDMGDLDSSLRIYHEALARFPRSIFARNGYADTLKNLGKLKSAAKVYRETMLLFPGNRVALRGYASLMVIMDQFEEVERLLSYLPDKIVSRDDWIGFHILTMSRMKRGQIDDAIARLEYGWQAAKWGDVRAYFGTALGVARIKKKEYREAIRVLSQDVSSLDHFQKQKRFAFIAHSKAELGEVKDAASTLAEVSVTTNRRIASLKQALLDRYNLNPINAQSTKSRNAEQLQKEIEQAEFYLALAA
ncbi:MAG TPA: tetratricopeptide repeat protein [Pyrinomonadaceae bacterium]|nr:tetratricopeptide repeat protein [Pyrinomonadaceae bacterium]